MADYKKLSPDKAPWYMQIVYIFRATYLFWEVVLWVAILLMYKHNIKSEINDFWTYSSLILAVYIWLKYKFAIKNRKLEFPIFVYVIAFYVFNWSSICAYIGKYFE